MDIKFFYSLILLSLLVCSNALGQKSEREKRIKEKDFPKRALDYIGEHFEDIKRINLYQEMSTDSITYEAKFKVNGYRHSVEFLPDGQLLDIEKQVSFSTIPLKTQEEIHQYWDQEFLKYKIIKCQEQTSDLGIRYEIEIKGKNKQEKKLYEYLFTENGTFLLKREILLRPMDMTLY